MDKSVVAVDESHRNESLVSGSKCSGSLVPINSIAIDINCEQEEIESPKHEHFSIRGYVSEKRKKDKKTCLPFASKADEDESDNINMPPLSAPKFRWWQCPECVPDQKNTLGMILAEQSDAGTSSYQNVVAGEKDNYFLTHCIQNIGDEHGSRDSRDVDYSYPSDKLIEFNPQFTEEHKAATNVMNNTERVRITEKANNNTPADEPEIMSSGSDEIVFSALPHKRKRKLRSLAEIINEDKSLTSEQYPKTKSAQIEADLNHQSHELEDSSDAKVTKTHHRKRKLIILDEDDIEPLETGPQIVKRSKGPVTEAENFIFNFNNNNNNGTCKQAGILESDSERDNRSALLDLRISAKTQQQHKARKQRSLDINRKGKRIDTEKRKTVATNETGFGNMGNVGLFVRNSLFEKQMDNASDMAKGKRPVEGDYSFYVPPSNKSGPDLDLSLSSFTGAEMNSEKQETSRKYTGIPDLNESIIEKTTMPDPSLHENLDISAYSGKETGREGKRPLVEYQPVQNTDNSTVGASDDIPMEIVELLAKNQRDRALDNSRKLLVPDDIHNPFRGSAYAETTPGPINFSYTNARSGLSGNIRPVQGFLNFPPSTNSDKNQFRRFSPLTLGQQHMSSYSGPNPISSAPRPRPSEASDLLWPPRRKNATFELNGVQNRSIQPNNGLEDPSYKGKSVNYMKGDERRAVTNGYSIKEGKVSPGRYKSVGSIDAYSNETIPAMQLLSLMDQGIVSGSSFKAGPSNFVNRPFSPCNHHPRLNKNDNQQNDLFVSSSFFTQSDRSKDFPTFLNGVLYSSDSSKKYFSQGQMPQQKGNSKAINVAGPSNMATQPSRSNLNLEVCTLNRNPADFSIPDAKNEFMISAKDLKLKKRNSSKDKSGARNVEGPKRQRVKKDLSRKDNSRK
ncbi:hypothetical protein CASFOL_022235 [Castilleja foliolosa]|uniref:Protein EMBRYONIC FLOWER 1 n=1 Tax=Castilleja foliolosa TaxID=1961234 RepID=A0ABD3CU05_9LAMI